MNLKNQMLLAMPGLVGDYFSDTLIYVCEHNDEGAMGIIINRPSNVSLLELSAQLGLPTNRRLADVPVLEGGPVASDRGFVLHSDDLQFDSGIELTEGICLSTGLDVLECIARDQGPKNYRTALGYAGWGAGQLEGEMAANAWLSIPAKAQVLFDVPFASRVGAAANSLGIDFRLISNRPGHA